MNIKTNRFKELDALRGIAALMVVLFHFTMGKPQANLGFRYGTTGVDLFFIISGFVIFMSISKVKSSSEFIINRISRLYPTYWFCVTLAFCIRVIASLIGYKPNSFTFIQYLGNMTMFQYYLKMPNLDGPYWTMVIEMIFYIGILFLFHFKFLSYLKNIGLFLILIITISTALFHNFYVEKLLIYIPLFQFLPLFFAGTIFYKLYTERLELVKNYAVLAICLIAQIMMFPYVGRSNVFITHFEYAVFIVIYFVLFFLFVNGKLKFLVNKTSLFFGKISFSLYLVHEMIATHFIIPIAINNFGANFWVATFLVALPFVIGLASLITFFVEIPLSRKMKEQLYLAFPKK